MANKTIFCDQNRTARWANFPIAADVAVETGDNVYYNGTSIYAVSAYTWSVSDAATRRAMRPQFAGVVANGHRSGDAACSIKVYTDVEVYQDISAAAVTVGQLMGIAGDGSTALYANTLIGVYETTEAIGIVTAKQASSTSVRVRLVGLALPPVEVLRAREDAFAAITDRPIASGGSYQGTRTDSSTQNYPLGTKRTYADGRVFRYVKARTALIPEVACCYAAKTITCAIAPAQATGAGTAGQFKVTMTVGGSDGLAGNGNVALNELAGGYVVVGNGADHPQNRLIIANTAVTGGGVCTLTMDEALDATVVVGVTLIETLMNPWIVSDAQVTATGFVTMKGMPAVSLTINHYGWVQTQGPCWVTSDGNTGKVARDRRVYFEDNGSVKSASTATAPTLQQLAGYVIDQSSNGVSNAPFINLCLETTA